MLYLQYETLYFVVTIKSQGLIKEAIKNFMFDIADFSEVNEKFEISLKTVLYQKVPTNDSKSE